MSLIKTMLELKIQLAGMKKHLLLNCHSLTAKHGLMNIVSSKESELEAIDGLISKGKYNTALKVISSHVYPRKKDFFLRQNYDYGEGWNAALDEFRDGKIKDVVELSRKLKRWPEGQEESVKDSNEKRIDTSVNNPDEKEKKRLNRAALEFTNKIAEDSLIPTESYCGSKRNEKYWSQLKDLDDDEHDQAIEDFIKYIKEIKC